ncbi:MAG: hypothetical protein IPK68_09960 [Bdellovibrionales bacterium]|nr:hypothetical protein [Bdellovibrionales bacterium]
MPLIKGKVLSWLQKRGVIASPQYTSPTWWHFTGYRKSDEDAFDLLGKILNSANIRAGTSQISLSQRGAVSGPNITSLPQNIIYEGPRACVADIPLECLRTHGRRYGCVGFGLNKDKLRASPVVEINAVLYADLHLQNKVVTHLSSGATSPEFSLLKPFVKVCDDNEDFIEIYSEREWRSAVNIPVNGDTLDCLIVPSKLVAGARRLLATHGLTRVNVIDWENEVGDLPERDFI